MSSESLAPPVARAQAGAPQHASAASSSLVDHFLVQLAKTVQRLRNYAPGNPLCEQALSACHQALVELGIDELVLRVTPTALLLSDNSRAGDSPIVRTELTRRLHRASVGSLSIAGAASPWEISQLCRALIDQPAEGAIETLGDVLQRFGIRHIHVTTMPAPQFFEMGAPPDARLACVADQQAWRARDIAARGAGGHLYQANKGWVRVDPACRLEHASLGDLALLADDPLKLAEMLARLSGEPSVANAVDAFERQLEQMSYIVRSLNPAFVEPMFQRLAETLLSLDDARRKHLLTTILLPGLLDGRFDGTLLRQLPDREIARGLVGLGEVQAAAPALMMFALDRLGLADDRRRRIESLLLGPGRESAGEGDAAPGRIGGYRDGRIEVDHRETKRFEEFSSYDLSLTEEVAQGLQDIRARIDASRREHEQLRCVLNLLRLESNPHAAAQLVARAAPVWAQYRSSGAWDEFAFWIGAFRTVADAAAADKPEVASQIRTVIAKHAAADVINALVDMATDERGRERAQDVIEALGPAAAAPAMEVLEREDSRGRRRVLMALMSARAASIADGLLPFLTRPQWFIVRNALYVLGSAGAGYERAVGGQTSHPDQRVAREAFRALAQIGTPEALAHVTEALSGSRQRSALAMEALWRFPAPAARSGAKAFLGRIDDVLKRPAVASALLDVLGRSDCRDLRGVLEELKPLRRRVWSVAAMRVGFKAASLARRT
ncbi:MAG TPA: hypothetical protein VNK41_05580 [Vicinamibacterales bacterium]|nr:hypothetical protein [Vicinamibacterales bacterium]